MFEFTKLIYLWWCIFIHLYFYFCTMFFFVFFLLLFFIWFVRCFYAHIVVTTDLKLSYRSDDLPVWPRACEPVQNLHVDQPISALLCTWIARRAFLGRSDIISHLWSHWSTLDYKNPKKGHQGYCDISRDTQLYSLIHDNILTDMFVHNWDTNPSISSEYEPFLCM